MNDYLLKKYGSYILFGLKKDGLWQPLESVLGCDTSKKELSYCAGGGATIKKLEVDNRGRFFVHTKYNNGFDSTPQYTDIVTVREYPELTEEQKTEVEAFKSEITKSKGVG